MVAFDINAGLLSIGPALRIKIANVAQDVTVNKAKTADKAFQAMDAYIRG